MNDRTQYQSLKVKMAHNLVGWRRVKPSIYRLVSLRGAEYFWVMKCQDWERNVKPCHLCEMYWYQLNGWDACGAVTTDQLKPSCPQLTPSHALAQSHLAAATTGEGAILFECVLLFRFLTWTGCMGADGGGTLLRFSPELSRGRMYFTLVTLDFISSESVVRLTSSYTESSLFTPAEQQNTNTEDVA